MKRKLKNRFLIRAWDMFSSLARLDVPAYAGNASYYIMLAVVPTVMLLLNIISYTSIENGMLLTVVEGLLPTALYPFAEKLLLAMADSSSTTLLSVTALTALWASSRGVYSILVGLNRVYDVQEDRNAIITRLLSLLYTFLLLLVLLLTLVLYVFRQHILSWLGQHPGLFSNVLQNLFLNRFILLLFIQIFLFVGMFMLMPNRRNRFLPSLPGALFAALGWQLFSYFFSIYVRSSNSYTSIYGSLATMALAMFWLYTCIAIIFYGGALNKYLTDIGYEIRLRRKKKLLQAPKEDEDAPEA